MTAEDASKVSDQYDQAVKSGYYLRWTLEELIPIRDELREARVALRGGGHYHVLETCEATLAKINERIVTKESEAKAAEEALKAGQEKQRDEEIDERRHKETLRNNRTNTLIAVIGILVAVVLAIVQCRDNYERDTGRREQLKPSATTPATNSDSPATAKSEPTVTETPELPKTSPSP